MLLQYTTADGEQVEVHVAEKQLTIGRSSDADIVIADEKASRLHSGIRFERGAYYLRDLKSKNGTYLNDELIESSPLEPGDHFRVGSTVFRVVAEPGKGADTAVHEVEEQMADGKGYGTILREIVDTVDGDKS